MQDAVQPLQQSGCCPEAMLGAASAEARHVSAGKLCSIFVADGPLTSCVCCAASGSIIAGAEAGVVHCLTWP